MLNLENSGLPRRLWRLAMTKVERGLAMTSMDRHREQPQVAWQSTLNPAYLILGLLARIVFRDSPFFHFGIFFILIVGINTSSAHPLIDPVTRDMFKTEQKHKIPKGLLSAIAKVESGRYHPQQAQIRPWPWVIHAEGEGQFFETKQEAIAAVRTLKAKGIKNIDVGLMQINLLYHPHAFSSLEQAFDPRNNIDYAAKFLIDLKKKHGSWLRAIAHYHCALPQYHISYRNKVMREWSQENQSLLKTWPNRDHFRFFNATAHDHPFCATKFRMIHVRSVERNLSSRNHGHSFSLNSKKKKSAQPSSQSHRIKRFKGIHRQKHFRLIKPQKTRSSPLSQKSLKHKRKNASISR